MKQPARFPLPYRIWIGASGGVFAVALGLQLFLSLTDYGFLNDYLLLVCLISFISLLVSLTVLLCRRVFKRVWAKVIASILCVWLLQGGVFFLCMFFSPMVGVPPPGG